MKLDTSRTGLLRATQQLAQNSHKTAVHGALPKASKTDYVTLSVDRVTTRIAFTANLNSLQADDETKATLLDIFG